MKRLILGLLTIGGVFAGASKASAQTFVPAHDTVYYTYSGTANVEVHNDITVPGASNVVLKWKVVDENFTNDTTWGNVGTVVDNGNAVSMCDNYQCYTNFGNALLNGTEYTSDPYLAGATGLLKAGFSLGNANPGTHFVTFSLKDTAGSNYTKNITFIVSKWPTSVTNVVRNQEITLYPNPTSDDLNVLFDASRDIKNVAVYNVIGKTMSVYRVNGSSAKMDVSKLPGGVYFIRLSDSKGRVVATKRFTKQ
jgi:hypothetical protein